MLSGFRPQILAASCSLEWWDLDAALGDRDKSAGFRISLRNHIKRLELAEQRSHEGKVRAWQLMASATVGIFVGECI